MTYKVIRYSKHAAVQLKKRHVTRETVRWLLAKGERVTADTRHGERRLAVQGKVGKRVLKLVYIERRNEIEIVTVMQVPE